MYQLKKYILKSSKLYYLNDIDDEVEIELDVDTL